MLVLWLASGEIVGGKLAPAELVSFLLYAQLLTRPVAGLADSGPLDADELIASSKASRLLAGFRGAPVADLGALRDVLLRVSKFVDDIPEIAELDLNPVVVYPRGEGAIALDALMVLGPMS